MKETVKNARRGTKRYTAAMLCLVMMGLFLAYGCDKPTNGTGDDSTTVARDSTTIARDSTTVARDSATIARDSATIARDSVFIILSKADSSVWKFEDEHFRCGHITIELVFYPSINKVHVQSTSEVKPFPRDYLWGWGDYIEDYRVIGNKLQITANGKFYDSSSWEITFTSENKMYLFYLGRYDLQGTYCLGYEFICQTEFKGI